MEFTPYADAYPLIRSGGVLLAIVGIGVALGAVDMKRRYLVLGASAVPATTATVFAAIAWSAPPSAFQLGALAAAIAFEVVAIAVAGRAFARRGERVFTLFLLGIIGLHFFIMAPAFGPPIAGLGALTIVNVSVGAWMPRYDLSALWLADGALKFAAGAAMCLAP